MIYTVTLNPSLDHYVRADGVIPLRVNRAASSETVCGGKGINVSLALTRLGIDNIALGFRGGFTGEGLVAELEKQGVRCRFVETAAETRINTKIVTPEGVTEINSPGSPVGAEAEKELIRIVGGLRGGDTVVLSGSVPPGFDTKALLEAISSAGVRFIADTSGEALAECLSYRPYLIKPNRYELYQLVERDGADIGECVRMLPPGCAENVLVSDGENGAYLFGDGGERFVPVIRSGMKAVNPTGAGDSMIAGFLYGEANGEDPLVSAVCGGSATAYCDGILTKDVFDTLMKAYKTYYRN